MQIQCDCVGHSSVLFLSKVCRQPYVNIFIKFDFGKQFQIQMGHFQTKNDYIINTPLVFKTVLKYKKKFKYIYLNLF